MCATGIYEGCCQSEVLCVSKYMHLNVSAKAHSCIFMSGFKEAQILFLICRTSVLIRFYFALWLCYVSCVYKWIPWAWLILWGTCHHHNQNIWLPSLWKIVILTDTHVKNYSHFSQRNSRFLGAFCKMLQVPLARHRVSANACDDSDLCWMVFSFWSVFHGAQNGFNKLASCCIICTDHFFFLRKIVLVKCIKNDKQTSLSLCRNLMVLVAFLLLVMALAARTAVRHLW